jgi:adenosine deaminase
VVRSLVAAGTPLTVCPLSNVQLKVVPSLSRHPLKRMLDAGLHVTVNSDDPPYFGGYVTENLLASQRALALSDAEVAILVRNGLSAAFWPEPERHRAVSRLDAYLTDGRSSAGASG